LCATISKATSIKSAVNVLQQSDQSVAKECKLYIQSLHAPWLHCLSNLNEQVADMADEFGGVDLVLDNKALSLPVFGLEEVSTF
jgi:hypothetical protein